MDKKKSILIVEDDLVAARAYQKFLEEAGYEVGCALDGEEGLAMAKNGYDCILLDIVLPKKDGWQVLRELKNHDGTKHTSVVICTVLDGDHNRAKAKELGADGFVNKFNDEVLQEVENVLGGGHLKKSSPKAS